MSLNLLEMMHCELESESIAEYKYDLSNKIERDLTIDRRSLLTIMGFIPRLQ